MCILHYGAGEGNFSHGLTRTGAEGGGGNRTRIKDRITPDR